MSENRRRFAVRAVLGCALASLGLALTTPAAFAQVPGRVSFQGLLLDSGGQPVNGATNLAFALFAAPTGGSPLWTESHPGTSVIDGIYDVQLGSITPLTPSVLAGSTRYLEVTVSGETLAPRRPLLSVPYALSAGTLPSFDALHGIPCNSQNPTAGSLQVVYAPNGAVTLSCSALFTLAVTIQGVSSQPIPSPVTSAPPGISCSAFGTGDCSEVYVGGTVVTLTAVPSVLYLFTGWSGACSGTGPCVVTMNASKSVTANFLLNL